MKLSDRLEETECAQLEAQLESNIKEKRVGYHENLLIQLLDDVLNSL